MRPVFYPAPSLPAWSSRFAVRASDPRRRSRDSEMSGVNYFFSLTTTISPGQRQLLLDSLGGAKRSPPGGGRSPPAALFFRLRERGDSWRWESGKPAFGFPLFHPPSSPELWKCGNLARCWRDFQGARGKSWKACLWLSTLSTDPAFPQLSFLLSLWFRRCRLHSPSPWLSAC